MEEPGSETLDNSLVQGLSSVGTDAYTLAMTHHACYEKSAHFCFMGVWVNLKSS